LADLNRARFVVNIIDCPNDPFVELIDRQELSVLSLEIDNAVQPYATVGISVSANIPISSYGM
jgi:hypothetical protein